MAKHKCDLCSAEATVTEVAIKNGQKVERHLCESCARQAGIAVQSHVPISELITKFVMSHGSTVQAAARALACESCGMTFADFRQKGLLGCPGCYKAFEQPLGPLIERAHEGATHHTGKVPSRAGATLDRQHRIAALRKQLNDAIAAEEYERAAVLRDELGSFERGPVGGTAPAREARAPGRSKPRREA